MEQPPVIESTPLPPVLEKKRYHDLDALRAFAMLVGIVLHGALSFFPVPIWPAQDLQQPMVEVPAALAAPLKQAGLEAPPTYSPYEFALHAIHGFRLPLFFLVSGFFTAMLWRNRGLKQLAKHRAKRILLPLVIFVPIMWILLIPVGIYGGFKKEEVRKRAGSLYSEAGESKGVFEQSDGSKSEGALPLKNDPKLEGPLKKFKYRVYYQQFTSLLDFDKLKPEFSRESEKGIIDLGLAKRKEEFGMVFEGELEIKEAGEFNFRLGSDDGSRLFINEKKLIDNDGTHGVQYKEGSVPLEPGMAKIRVDYFDWGGNQRLSLSVSGPGMDELSGGSDKLFLSEEKGAEERGSIEAGLEGLVWLIFFAPVFHHLWFLYYLVWLVAGFIAVTWLLGKLKWKSLPDWLVTSPWRWLWLLPITFVAQLLMSDSFGPATAPGFLPWPPTLIYYAIFFFFGAVCFGRDTFETKIGKLWPLSFVLAVPPLLAGLCLVKSQNNAFLLAACSVAYAWLMIFGFIGFFRHFFSGENPRIRYISDSSYSLYIMHLPVIMFVQAWISPWDLPAFPKFLIACAATTLPLLLIYEFVVRYTFIGTMLNGKRTREPA